MKKPLTALLLALVLLASLRTAGAAGPNGTISVALYDHAAGRYQSVQADVVTLTLDGAPLSGDVPALVQAGRTLVPVRLVAEGIDEDFYQRVRRSAFGDNLRGLNSFENIAVSLTEGYFHGYDPLRFPQVFDTITKDDITAFLRDNITGDRMVLSEIVPKEA